MRQKNKGQDRNTLYINLICHSRVHFYMIQSVIEYSTVMLVSSLFYCNGTQAMYRQFCCIKWGKSVEVCSIYMYI